MNLELFAMFFILVAFTHILGSRLFVKRHTSKILTTILKPLFNDLEMEYLLLIGKDKHLKVQADSSILDVTDFIREQRKNVSEGQHFLIVGVGKSSSKEKFFIIRHSYFYERLTALTGNKISELRG
ncbi:MAG: hypothetical protein IBX57_00700 [Gammaproteobacteria bacterium]|nr:hypothetical protein [Gammaproteobacteria bacterium]